MSRSRPHWAASSVEEMTRAGTATQLPGVGKTIEEKLNALLDTGTIPSAEKLKAKYPQLKMVIWYDKQDSPQRDWQINSSTASLDAFRRALDEPGVLDADAAMITASPHVRG